MKWLSEDVTKKASCCPGRLIQLQFTSTPDYAMKKRWYKNFATELKRKLSSDEGNYKVLVHCPKRIRRICSRTKVRSFQRKLATVFDIYGDYPIHVAVANEELELTHRICLLMTRHSVSLDIPNSLKQMPLHLAVMLGNIDITRLLLRFGASPLISDRNGNSVLHLALKSNCTNVLNVLLSSEQSKSILNVMDYEGYSALHYAVLKSNEEAVKILHAHGTNMNKTDGKSGRTSLIHAVLEENLSMVNLLLNCDACPQKADYSGRTAIDMALQTGNVHLIKLFEIWIPHSDTSSIKEQVKPPIKSSIKMRKEKLCNL